MPRYRFGVFLLPRYSATPSFAARCVPVRVTVGKFSAMRNVSATPLVVRAPLACPCFGMQGWELSVADQRRLYLLISDTLGSEGKAVESQKVSSSFHGRSRNAHRKKHDLLGWGFLTPHV